MLFRVFQDLIARDQSPFYLIERDEPSELHQSTSFVPGNRASVRFKETEHFFA